MTVYLMLFAVVCVASSSDPVPETNSTITTIYVVEFAHADISMVEGGGLVPMEAEPGMPDVTTYEFSVHFGEGSEPLPDRSAMGRALAPPLSASLPAAQSLIDVQGPAELICVKRAEAGDGQILRLRAGPGGGTAVITPWQNSRSAWIADLVERPVTLLPVVGGAVTVPLVAEGIVTVLLRD